MTGKDKRIIQEFLAKQDSKVLAFAEKCRAVYYDHLRHWVFPAFFSDGTWDGKSYAERDFCKELARPEELSLLLQDAYRLGAFDLANHLGVCHE